MKWKENGSDADGHMNAELTELKAEGASAGGWNTAEADPVEIR